MYGFVHWSSCVGYASVVTVCLLLTTHHSVVKLVAWLSDSMLVLINKVNLLRAQLVLRWATVFWACKPSRCVTSHPGQLSLAIPVWVGTMSTGVFSVLLAV